MNRSEAAAPADAERAAKAIDTGAMARSPAYHPLPPDRPLRLSVLSNPRSGRNRKHLPEIHRRLLGLPHIAHREARTPAQIADALASLADTRPDVLVVNGGDGTIQATLTALLGQRPFRVPPAIAVLRGGTTNMTAGDVGLRGHPGRALGRLLAWAGAVPRPPAVLQRPVVRVCTAAGAAPRYGMFFGIGAIVRGMEYFHARVASLPLRESLSPGIAIARGVIAIARRDASFVAPVSVAAGLDGQPPGAAQDTLLLLVSSLERLFFGLHPYWGTEPAPLHLTTIRSNPYRPLRVLPALLRGRPSRHRTPAAGYTSHNVNEVQLRMNGAFALDGEIYPVDDRHGPLVVSDGGRICFVRP